MAPRSLQDHVQSLIGRTVAEQKYVGTQPTDVEARAVLESIAMSLLLKPRSVLYLANLARNGLLNVVTKELTAIDTLSQTVDDTGNATFTPNSTLYLDTARTALVQMEGLEKVDTQGNDYQRFSGSLDNFLNKTLAKSVRKSGNTELSRPDTEAASDLPTDFSALTDFHTELNQRLFALSVGIENFSASPLGTILGLSTAYRTRLDIEDIIDIINSGDSGSQLRDIAVRIIGDRASVKTIGSLPVIDSLLIDTFNQVPPGYTMQGETDPATASVTGSVVPFTFATSATASVTVNGSTLTASHFPQSAVHLDNRAFIVSSPGIAFPITVPSGSYLFLILTRPTTASGFVLQADGTYQRQVRIPFTVGARTLAQTLTDLNAALGSDATAYEYLQTGTGRIIIIGDSNLTAIQVVNQVSETSTSTLGDPIIYNISANNILGFAMNLKGFSGSTPAGIVIDALNLYFSALIAASITSDQKILVETVADSPGTSMTLALDASLGLTGTFHATSASLRLFGTILGVATDPIDPTPLLDVGDTLELHGSVSATVAGLTSARITLATPVVTFTGDLTATSALATAIDALDAAVQTFLTSWLKTTYAQGLTTLDRAIAALSGKSTPATRNAVKALLTDLKNQVQALVSVLGTGTVPSNVGTDEQSVVNGIVNTLTERKFDKALDLLLQLQVQEFFEMTGDTASYGGSLLSSMSAIATTDIKFPNTQLDEASGLKGVIDEPTA